jgi:hypothetical protein
MRREQVHSWVHRSVIIGLLAIGYLTVWSPARDALMGAVVHPVLTCLIPPDSEATVGLHEASGTVRIDLGDESPSGRIPPPAGIRFLLPAAFLILVASSRPYWLLFWSGHVLLTTCVLLWWVFAIRYGPIGAHIASFMSAYIVDAYSLVIPILAVSSSGKVPAEMTEA